MKFPPLKLLDFLMYILFPATLIMIFQIWWHMQNMQISEFLHLLGHSSGSAGSWDVFRGRWHHTAISGILLLRGVLSRAGWGCFLRFFTSSTAS